MLFNLNLIGWKVNQQEFSWEIRKHLLQQKVFLDIFASGHLLRNVFENWKRTFSDRKTTHQPFWARKWYLVNKFGPIFRISFWGRPRPRNGVHFRIYLQYLCRKGVWIWIVTGFHRSWEAASVVMSQKQHLFLYMSHLCCPKTTWKVRVVTGLWHGNISSVLFDPRTSNKLGLKNNFRKRWPEVVH